MKNQVHFHQRCYHLLKQVPVGKVTTYSEIARALNTTACRAVGTAMAKNEHLIDIPCHRVVRVDGSVGQYALGSEKKIQLLIDEGIEVENAKVKNMDIYLHTFNTV